MWRNMTTSLLEHERIETTDEKAKELRGFVEHMITLAKRARAMGDGQSDQQIAARQVHLRRQALAFIRDGKVVKKLFDEIAERFEDRPGGYTRIIKIGIRRGDAAKMSFIELIPADEKLGDAKKTTKKKAKSKAKPKAKAKAPVEETVVETPAEETAPVVEETAAVEAPVEEAPAEEAPAEEGKSE
jgi:large subunit ribosomal protein L17